jgi:hypothetical protein
MEHTNIVRVALVSLVIPLGLAACASGNKHAYHLAKAELGAEGSGSVAVCVVDQREPVVTGKKDPNWVGFNRGGFGNTFDVRTASGNPLATDMGTSICASLEGSGFSCTVLSALPAADPSGAGNALAGAQADKKLLLTVTQWKADAYSYGAIDFDVVLTVMDGSGSELGKGELKGSEEIGGSMWNPKKEFEKNVPIVFEQKLGELLNQGGVKAALHE